MSPEEVVIEPRQLEGEEAPEVDVRIHFPRLGFVVRPWDETPTGKQVKSQGEAGATSKADGMLGEKAKENADEPVQVEVGESVEIAKPKL